MSLSFFHTPSPTQIYTLSLHDALPIYTENFGGFRAVTNDIVYDINDFDETANGQYEWDLWRLATGDRKSTRLNSSHANISYAVFCLKKKNKNRLDAEQIARRHHRTYDQ